MSALLADVIALVQTGDVRVSVHGYRRLAAHSISIYDVESNIRDAEVVEDYPNYHAGPTVLVLQTDAAGNPIHVMWGLMQNTIRLGVLVTTYRPDPARWSADFRRRLP